MKDKATYTVSEPALPPHLPAITVLPAHPIDINRRALAQSKRYIAARWKKRKASDSVRLDGQEFGDIAGGVSVRQARDWLKLQFTPEVQDLYAAGTLLAVTQEQPAITRTPELEDMSIATVDEPDKDILFKSSWTSPFSTCKDYHKRYSLKGERNKHTMMHIEGMRCGHTVCRWSSSIYESTQDVEVLEKPVRKSDDPFNYDKSYPQFECKNCSQNFNQLDYIDHLDGCVLHTVEREASENTRPCPVSSCDEHLTNIPSRYLRGQHLFLCHLDAWMRRIIVMRCNTCSRSFGLRSPDRVFERHISENHEKVLLCPICCRSQPNEWRLFAHFDTCYTRYMENAMRS